MRAKLYANPFCLAFGHNYFLLDNLTTSKQEIICKCCKNYFRYSISGKIIEIPYKRSTLYRKLSLLRDKKLNK